MKQVAKESMSEKRSYLYTGNMIGKGDERWGATFNTFARSYSASLTRWY